MKEKILIALLFLINSIYIFAQNHTISGYITDTETGETLIGATIFDKEALSGTISNEYGFFSLTLKKSKPTLTFSYIGYEEQDIKLDLIKSETFNLALKPNALMLNEVVISTTKRSNPVKINEFSIAILTPKTIKELPIAFGESDIIKGVQLQSGVSSLGEGSSGMFVQGGNSDQNLIIIDEAPIYNPSHLFGLVSVFNPDAIKNIEFHKGSMPAEYGGRISSVIDCQMNDGNKYKHQISGGIGTLTAHASVDGPIKKDTASYLVAVRRSIRDLFQNPDKHTSYVPQFYDINAKLNWNINNKNRFFFSVYTGKDKILTNDDFTNTWGNTSFTLRWNHTVAARLFSNISVIYSNYRNNWDYTAKSKNYNWLTGIEDIQAKINFNWYFNPKCEFKFGVESTYHQFIPGENSFPEQSLFRINAVESSAYLQNDIDIADWLGIIYGLRFSVFQNVGEGQWYQYSGNTAFGTKENTSGIYHSNYNLEPRVTLNIRPLENHALKLSYSRTAQYYQILQNSIFSYTSLQTWLPVNPNIEPLEGNIYAAGYFINIDEKYSFSTEAYYKTINNMFDYIDHAELINNPYIETQIRSGIAKGYGVSVEVKRESQKLMTSVNYTHSNIKYDIEGINSNNAYPALQNIPNDIRIAAIYKPSERLGISAFWTYHSGYVVTLPTGYAVSDPFDERLKIPIYTERNAGKLPDYHRLDMSVILYPMKNTKRWKGTWSAGIYNVYNRLNPIGVDLTESQGGQGQAYFYTFYRMIPNISYSFKF